MAQQAHLSSENVRLPRQGPLVLDSLLSLRTMTRGKVLQCTFRRALRTIVDIDSFGGRYLGHCPNWRPGPVGVGLGHRLIASGLNIDLLILNFTTFAWYAEIVPRYLLFGRGRSLKVL